jgi:hypothetical protein
MLEFFIIKVIQLLTTPVNLSSLSMDIQICTVHRFLSVFEIENLIHLNNPSELIKMLQTLLKG